MYRLTVLYPPPADADHFTSYYLSTHLPLAAKLPGLQSMRYSLEVAAVDGESPYFAVWEAEFDSLAAMGARSPLRRGRPWLPTSRTTPPAGHRSSTTR
ncbi:EthD family reductase [Nocardia brasiliensis]|uniref:EthD family reductase n=1 Tax=Nocardia brasiliensis TaxID=37326 RepID=UPI000A3F7036